MFFTHHEIIVGMYAFHYQMNNTFMIIPNYFNEIHAHIRVILNKHIIQYMSMKNAQFFSIHAQIYSVKRNLPTLS